MAEAEVGDDAYGEDPTVHALEEAYAAMVGKEAGLFVPSGTMANQIAMRILAPVGTIVLAGRSSHLVAYEGGASGVNAVAQLQPLDDRDGAPSPAEVAWHVAAADHHRARPSLLCLENTAMAAGGVPITAAVTAELAACGLPVHLDGARLFNASVALGVPPADLAAPCVLVWSALSKGLGAPVGSVLAGSAAAMTAARDARRLLGGQLRQAGVLAAAGLVGLRDHVERLADDHARARRLAEAVAERWPDALDPSTIRTNMVVFSHPDAAGLLEHLRGHGVLAGTIGPGQIRLVTHLDVDDAGIDRACGAIGKAA